jgi:ketosteroid isomerase-like protein
MSAEEHRRIALALMEALPRDFATARNYLADEFIWWSPGFGDIALQLEKTMRHVKGRLKGPLRFTVSGLTAEGDRVAVEAESYGEVLNGKVYNNRYHFLLIFAGGKVSVVREYNDTKHSAEVWSGA